MAPLLVGLARRESAGALADAIAASCRPGGPHRDLVDYHLRVGQITHDTRLPEGQTLREQRLDETEAGERTTITLIDASHPAEWVKQQGADGVAETAGP